MSCVLDHAFRDVGIETNVFRPYPQHRSEIEPGNKARRRDPESMDLT